MLKKKRASKKGLSALDESEDDVSQEILRRLRETQKQLTSANERADSLEAALSQSQEKKKEALAEVKKLNKLLGMSENPGLFGNDSRKELKLKLLKAQEELKETQTNSEARVQQLTLLLSEAEKKANLARDTATRTLQQLNQLQDPEGDVEDLASQFAAQCLELQELQEQLCESRVQSDELQTTIEQLESDLQFQAPLLQQAVQISKAVLAVFSTARKEGVKFSPLLIGLVEQLQAIVQLSDEGRTTRKQRTSQSPAMKPLSHKQKNMSSPLLDNKSRFRLPAKKGEQEEEDSEDEEEGGREARMALSFNTPDEKEEGEERVVEGRSLTERGVTKRTNRSRSFREEMSEGEEGGVGERGGSEQGGGGTSFMSSEGSTEDKTEEITSTLSRTLEALSNVPVGGEARTASAEENRSHSPSALSSSAPFTSSAQYPLQSTPTSFTSSPHVPNISTPDPDSPIPPPLASPHSSSSSPRSFSCGSPAIPIAGSPHPSSPLPSSPLVSNSPFASSSPFSPSALSSAHHSDSTPSPSPSPASTPPRSPFDPPASPPASPPSPVPLVPDPETDMHSSPEVVEVLVFEARGLPWFEVDPYVTCELLSVDGTPYAPLGRVGEQQTCCLSKTHMGGEYGWNEVFAFGMEREGEKTTANLRMMVKMFSPETKNENGEDLFLGMCEIGLDNVIVGIPTYGWYTLTTTPAPVPEARQMGRYPYDKEAEEEVEQRRDIDIHLSFRWMKAHKFVCNRAWFGPSADSADQKRQSQEKPPGYLGKISDTMETIREVLMAERVMTEEEIAMQMYLLEQEDGESMSEVERAISAPSPDMQALPALLQTAMEDPNFNPNFKVNGRGYLHFLAEAGAARVMKRLVQMGCSVREYDDEGVAPVHIAAAAGHLLCLKLLLDEDGSLVNYVDDESRSTPLHYAAAFGKARSLTLLLDRGARVDQIDQHGACAMMKAAFNNHKHILKLLVKHNAKVHCPDKEDNSAFLVSCLRGHFECCMYLKKRMPSWIAGTVYWQNKRGDTTIWGTILHNNLDFLKALLSEELPNAGGKGISDDVYKGVMCTHTLGEQKLSLLHRALLHLEEQQCYTVLKHLLSCGVDINGKTKDDKTPIFMAAYKSRTSVLSLLLEADGINVFAKDNGGNTALHFTKNVEVAAKLMSVCENNPESRTQFCNEKNNQGNTPLHVAFALNNTEMANFLLTHGADPTIRNNNGNRPEECCWSRTTKLQIPFFPEDEVLEEGAGLLISSVHFCQ